MVPGISSQWQALMNMVEKIAPANAPVLIQGETGSGKEVVARKLHALSPRRDHPFLAVNCGALRGYSDTKKARLPVLHRGRAG
ncbi:MAG: hypothetical protein C4293_13785 [Nitrospiraceae bacterium]